MSCSLRDANVRGYVGTMSGASQLSSTKIAKKGIVWLGMIKLIAARLEWGFRDGGGFVDGTERLYGISIVESECERECTGLLSVIVGYIAGAVVKLDKYFCELQLHHSPASSFPRGSAGRKLASPRVNLRFPRDRLR